MSFKPLLFAALLCALSATILPIDAQETCTTDSTDPYSAGTFAEGSAEFYCVKTRCEHTLPGLDFTSATGGFCNGDATLEKDVSCEQLLSGYRAYYGCLSDSGLLEGVVPADLATMYKNSPGVPVSVSGTDCYGCNNFAVLAPQIGTTCAWTCASVAGQASSRTTGYGHVLCGIGCTCALYMIPFTIVSLLLFLGCCICIPTPNRRDTAEKAKEEEEREERRRNGYESEEEEEEEEEGEEAEEEQQQEEGSPKHSSHEPIEPEQK